jgi:hypothetical protein
VYVTAFIAVPRAKILTMGESNQASETGKTGLRYDVPYYYGGAGAIESMSSIAAPLLAGGALAFIGIVLQQQQALRFPGAVLLISLTALMALIFAVQCGYWARQHAVTPQEIEQWWPDLDEEVRLQRVRADWWQEKADYTVWAGRTRLLFGFGVTAVWLAVGIAVVPTATDKDAVLRWLAVSFCLVIAIMEALWLLISSKPMRSTFLGKALAGPRVNPPPYSLPK